MSAPLKFVILASGQGSNARALLEHARAHPSRLVAQALISDRPGIPALDLPAEFGIPAHVVNHREEKTLLDLLKKYSPRWALLAGYKRIVGQGFLDFFQDDGFFRVMNVHPSLLPAYPGLGGYERAFRDGVPGSGVTVHLVDAGLDTGPVVLQQSFSRAVSDTLEKFSERGRKIEHEIYCRALDLAAAGEIKGKR